VIRHLPGGPVANHRSTGFFLAVIVACGLLWHLPEPGQSVERGMPVGRSGNNGYSKAPHLHFGITGPLDGKRRRSFPTLFQTGRGLSERLEEGDVHTAQ
jgi:hypothetical protein